MKRVQYGIFCMLLLAAASAGAQNHYIVNNQPGSQANYTSLQGAIDSVPAGSIILLQPSGIDYGNVSIHKPLVIYGAGYFLGENAPPATQARFIASRVKFIRLGSGASGTLISGVHFTRLKNNTDATLQIDTASDITVSRCYFENFAGLAQGSVPRFFHLVNTTNITIRQNYFATSGSTGWNDALMYTAGSNAGIQYLNNIISGEGNTNAFGNNGTDQVSFINNTFLGNIGSHLNGNLFYNNVILYNPNQQPFFFEQMSAAGTNNISNRNIFPNSAANKTDTSFTANVLFVGGSMSGVTSTDGYFLLKPNTAASGYSTDGKDCGAFGGTKPYVLSGIPAIPHFYAVEVSTDATVQGGLKIQLKVKANQ
jgi:hypothetical protein